MRRKWAQQRCGLRELLLAAALACLGLSVVTAARAQPEPPGTAATSHVGLHWTFEQLLERQERLSRGDLVRIGPTWLVRQDLGSDTILHQEVTYSPSLEVVFKLQSPGFLPGPAEYYLYDGAYYVYQPRSFEDPSLHILALPRDVQQARQLEKEQRDLLAQARGRNLGQQGQREAGTGFEVTVVKALPGPLSTMFGRDATTIRVTGRESISFAGESRRISPYIANEQGRGQSLFPRLDMNQDLQVKLEGNVGGKVHVAVDHNSSAFGADANKVNVWYEGYEDDIVRRIDLGGTNLVLPGSRLVAFAGLSQGVFGVKTDLRLGSMDLTVLAAKEETEAETRTLTPSGGSASTLPIEENRYIRDRFFFYELPDTTLISQAPPEAAEYYWNTYGLDLGQTVGGQYIPGKLINTDLIPKFEVFIDDRNPNTVDQRKYTGYAMANLPPGLTDAAMDSLYDGTVNVARWPNQEAGVHLGDPSFQEAHWRRLEDDEIGWVRFEVGGQTLILGFYLQTPPLGNNFALAVSFLDLNGRNIGSYDDGGSARLRLIRHPDQDRRYTEHPTSLLMMRHVYSMGSTNIEDLEVSIQTRDTGNTTPEIPPKLPASTYLHMYGLDDIDQGNNRSPDGLFDTTRPNLWDRENGFLFMPGLRPFSPPDNVIISRLISAGVSPDSATTYREELFGPSETVEPTLYTLPEGDPLIPSNRFSILVRTAGTETEITLPQDILEGSDVVKLDGRTLQRGVDYDIEPFAGGKITFKGPVLNEISPSSRIEVSYAFRPFLGTGQATLLGASGKYNLGSRGHIASVWLWESRRSFARQPQLGDEPTTNLVGDVNTNLRFQPSWMTRMVNWLPFTRTNAASNLAIAAEAAVSVPNPNTKNTAFVEDMENADTSDRLSNGREAWHWPSLVDPLPVLADSVDRIPTAFYNPVGRVKRGHLNPTLPENEANDGVTVLELGFDRETVRTILTNDPAKATQLWGGLMTAFAGNGLDLTQSRTLEFWFNDGIGNPANRHGRMHVDFGDISEDFVLFENNPNRNGGALTTNPRFNREAETEIEFIPNLDDFGWNGRDDDCEQVSDSNAQWPQGEDCHIPSKLVSATNQFPWANGTEGNNRFDTEDINGDGEWDTKNSFFRFTVDLADTTSIEPGTDIYPTYYNDGTIDPRLKSGFQGWRHYRFDLQDIVLDTLVAPGQSAPSLRQVRYVRIWFEDPEAPADPNAQLWTTANFQLYDFKFTGNQWLQLGVFATDSTRVTPAADEAFSVSVVNNKDNPEYTIPPDAELIDTAGVQAREQSLRMSFVGLRPGHEMVTQKTNPSGRPTDYTLYNRMNFFTNVAESSMGDSLEMFYRMGTDSLNYYEVARRLVGASGWVETIFALRDLTDLKFPEDLGVPVDTLELGGRQVVQVSRTVPDGSNPMVSLKLTRRGNPSLKQVGRLFFGVRHPSPASDLTAFPLSGEVWFNNVRLEDPKREIGTAQLYGLTGNFADVFDFTTNWNLRGAEFRGLRQTSGSGSDTYGCQTRFGIKDAARVIPTLGFSVPLSYTYARDVSKPKFFTSSDTENDAERAYEQRTESVRRGYGFSVTKQPSKFILFKPTLDRLSFSYNQSRTLRRSYTSRDTSTSWSQNLNYDLSPRARPFPIGFKQQLNLLPTNIKFGVQHQKSQGVAYTVDPAQPDVLISRPSVRSRSLNWNASGAMRPLNVLNARYGFTETRDYRDAHPDNEDERVKILGFDFGIPTGRNESLSFDVNPRFLQYSYGTNYGDRRTQRLDADTGRPLPDVHQLLNGRNHRLSFDFKLHRRLLGWAAPPRQSSPPPPPPPPQGEGGGTPPNEGAGSDSTGSEPKRPFPNPVKAVARLVGGIEPVKVEFTDSRTASYIGVPQEAQYLYRFGISDDSGVPGFDVPSPINTTRTLNMSSAVPLRGALRVTVRFGMRNNDVETRAGRDSTLRVNVNSNRETNFPNLELNITDLQKLKFFGSRLQRSTLSLGLNRTSSERYSRDFDALGAQIGKDQNRRESNTLVVNGNWTGQWTGTTATTLSMNQTKGQDKSVGQRSESTRRTVQGTLRFKISPQGGLKLPWVGTLKTGVDVILNLNYTSDESFLYNDPNNPEKFILQRQNSSISSLARGDYTLSRNMTGGLELGYTRSRDNKNNQTVTTIRLGFNLTFLF